MPRPRYVRPLLEELEPRVLMSADAAAGLADPTSLVDDRDVPVEELLTPLSTSSEGQSATRSSVRREVAFVSADVRDSDALIRDLRARSADASQLHVVALDPDADGLEQIAQALAHHQELDAIHVISHGEQGRVQLGSSWLDAGALSGRADLIAGWGDALAQDGDLLFWGCDLASGPRGEAFLTTLSELTGADVAASADRTGHVSRAGDWQLEFATGPFDAAAPVSAEFQAAWMGVLAAPGVGDGAAIWSESGSPAPEGRDFNAGSFGPEFTAANIGGPWEIIAGAEAPTRDEKIVVGMDSNGDLSGMIWNGSSWSALPFNDFAQVSDKERWSFDVAYDSQTGDAMLVYNNGSGLLTSMTYRIWNGTSWSGASLMLTPLLEQPEQMRLAANPHASEMVLVVSTENKQDYALVWNGATWGNPISLHNGNNAQDNTDVSVAYEQQSGHAMVVYAKDVTSASYRTWNGSSWSAEGVVNAPAGASGKLRWTTLASDPGSDRIGFAGSTESKHSWMAIWDGSSWGSNVLGSSNAHKTDHLNVAIAFESDSGDAIAAYDTDTNRVQFRIWSAAIGWSAQQTGPDFGEKIEALTLDADPASDAVVLSVHEHGRQVSFSDWDGDSWATPVEVETDAGTQKGQPFLFLWDVTSAANSAPNANDAVLSVAENSALGTLVGTVTATDPDAGDTLTYTIVGGNPGNAFAIDAATGEITVSDPAALDFETTPSFSLQIQVSDSGTPSLTDTATVVVDLTNVNEAPAVSVGPFTVAESSAAGTVVGTVTATDPDAGDTLTYTIVGGNPGNAFAIDSVTGEITVSDPAALDFEATASFSLQVQVSDSGTPSLTDTATVVVSLTNANEAPAVSVGPFTVAESSAAGTVVGTVTATDPDAGDTLTYTIVGGNPGNAFAIDSVTGEITVSDPAALDFEATASFSLQVQVSDSGTPSLTDTATVVVNLTNANEAPTVSGGPFAVAENANAGTVVGTVAATDPDAGDTLTYTIVGGNPGNAFAIDAATGEITVSDPAALDFETTPSFSLQIQVNDSGTPSLTDTATVVVSLTNANEAPSVTGGLFTVAENAAAGTVVGSVTGSDPDAGDTLTYTIVGGNPGNAFAIDAATGEITVSDPAALDFETTPSFSLQIQVNDSGTPSLTDTATVVVSLTNANEAPSVTGGLFTVAENAAAGTVVGSVTGSDPDAGDTLSYAIVGGNPGNAFAIDAATGEITVSDPAALDFEATPSFSLQIQVNDSGTPSLTDTATVVVNLTNVNEAPTVSGGPFTVVENSAAGTVVGSVTGSDPDASDTLSYAIVGGNVGNAFAIDAATGEITVSDPAALDFEATPSFSLQVQVSDSGTPSLTDTATVVVSLTNVNEAPTVSGGPFTVVENSAAGTVVGSVTGSDPDASDTLSYAIVGGNVGNAFAIDSVTGEITVSDPAALASSGQSSYALLIRATDAGSPAAQAEDTVTVQVATVGTEPEVDVIDLPPAPDETPVEPPESESALEVAEPSPVPAQEAASPTPPPPPDGAGSRRDAFRISPTREVAPAVWSSDATWAGRADDAREDSEDRDAFALFGDGAPQLEELDQLRNDVELREQLEEQLVASAFAISTGFSIGYALLLTRGGWLLASLLSSLPAWRLVDPLPILARLGDAEDQHVDDDSLESLVDRDREVGDAEAARSRGAERES